MQQVCLCPLTDYLFLTFEPGICLAQHSDDQDEDDTVSLEGMHPKISEKKIEEKIEALLSPDAKSLFVKIVVARKAVHAKKQKVNVSMLLDRYVWFAPPQSWLIQYLQVQSYSIHVKKRSQRKDFNCEYSRRKIRGLVN